MPDRNVQTAFSQIAELKVSGHTMALDTGLYCVFSAPGSARPADDTGLPIVRISAAPGHSEGRVEVVGLDAQGWIGPEAATLVRITAARSNVLVTVYQAKDARAEAPQLQVVRISSQSEAAMEPAAKLQTAAMATADLAATADVKAMDLVAHIYGLGDVGGLVGQWVGEPGSNRWIEGFAIAPVGDVPAADIEYQAVLGRGWLSPWSEGGQFCGSRSMSLPILGLRVRLRGGSAATHRIVLSAAFVDGSKVGPVGDGEPCEAPSLAALEAFQIAIERVGQQPVAASSVAAAAPAGRQPSGRKKAAKLAEPAVPSARAKHSATQAAAPVAAKPAAQRGKAPVAAAGPAAPKPRSAPQARASSKIPPTSRR